MPTDPIFSSDLRRSLKDLRSTAPEQWEASRHLVGPRRMHETLDRLRETITRTASAGETREALLKALPSDKPATGRDGSAEALKQITGLPTTKALRALCVFFGLVEQPRPAQEGGLLADETMLARLTEHANPFELLLEAERPSLLDLGAGDLSFVESLAAQYVSSIRDRERTLLVHALDRIHPGSSLGSAYQASPDRLRRLEQMPGLTFRHWNDLDMFSLIEPNRPRALLSRYDLVTCWAPANPTFAYEPTRLSPSAIHEDLERTRGTFRHVRIRSEPALEVRHRDRSLLFPPWKFDVRGPVALVDLMTRCGTVAVLGAVDSTVFWELLAQLVADPRYRPPEVVFDDDTRPRVFGSLYERLMALPQGERVTLEDLTPLREDFPRVLSTAASPAPAVSFRHVEIRRGATFPNLPSSLTARRYRDMTEEAPPWFLVLVPRR